MSAGEVAAVVASVAAVVAVGVLVFVVVQLVRTMTALRLSLETLGRPTPPVVEEPRPTATVTDTDQAGADDRPEPVVFVPARVGANPGLVHRAFSASPVIANPAIKAVALASGTARVAKVLRHR